MLCIYAEHSATEQLMVVRIEGGDEAVRCLLGTRRDSTHLCCIAACEGGSLLAIGKPMRQTLMSSVTL